MTFSHAQDATLGRERIAEETTLFGITRVAARRDRPLSDALHTIARTHGHRGVFNPSLGRLGSSNAIAYRAIPPGSESIRAFLTVWSEDPRDHTMTDLTSLGESKGLTRVADPKFVSSADALFITFNTGFTPKRENDIFLIRVLPSLGEPQRIVADFDRQQIEKNWAFVLPSSAPALAVYQLDPYREAHLSHGTIGGIGDLHFTLRSPRRSTSANAQGLAIGTQLSAGPSDTHRLIAHEKIVVRGKRSYFGRPVTLAGIGTDDVRVSVSRSRMIHSLRAALPRRPVHNRNLMSATYFSGILRDGEDVLLGYGINDVDFSIARLPGAAAAERE